MQENEETNPGPEKVQLSFRAFAESKNFFSEFKKEFASDAEAFAQLIDFAKKGMEPKATENTPLEPVTVTVEKALEPNQIIVTLDEDTRKYMRACRPYVKEYWEKLVKLENDSNEEYNSKLVNHCVKECLVDYFKPVIKRLKG